GYPRYAPGEFSASELLARGEVDACLLVGSESVSLLPAAARKRLEQIPTIVLDYPHFAPAWTPDVRFTTAVYGIHAAGTAYRMDETPIPLRSVLASDYPTDAEVLTRLRQSVRPLQAGPHHCRRDMIWPVTAHAPSARGA